jgi:hypothetical protein
MNDPASHQPAPHDPLTALRGQFPGWDAWRGISGLLYVRRRMSSPPVVFRRVHRQVARRPDPQARGPAGSASPARESIRTKLVPRAADDRRLSGTQARPLTPSGSYVGLSPGG